MRKTIVFIFLLINLVFAQSGSTNSTEPTQDDIDSENGEFLEPETLDLQDGTGSSPDDDDDSNVMMPEEPDENYDTSMDDYYFETDPNQLLDLSNLERNRVDLSRDCDMYNDCFNCSLSENRCTWIN